jgi:hypothetical protein
MPQDGTPMDPAPLRPRHGVTAYTTRHDSVYDNLGRPNWQRTGGRPIRTEPGRRRGRQVSVRNARARCENSTRPARS